MDMGRRDIKQPASEGMIIEIKRDMRCFQIRHVWVDGKRMGIVGTIEKDLPDPPVVLCEQATEAVRHAIAEKVFEQDGHRKLSFVNPPPPIPEKYLIRKAMA